MSYPLVGDPAADGIPSRRPTGYSNSPPSILQLERNALSRNGIGTTSIDQRRTRPPRRRPGCQLPIHRRRTTGPEACPSVLFASENGLSFGASQEGGLTAATVTRLQSAAPRTLRGCRVAETPRRNGTNSLSCSISARRLHLTVSACRARPTPRTTWAWAEHAGQRRQHHSPVVLSWSIQRSAP